MFYKYILLKTLLNTYSNCILTMKIKIDFLNDMEQTLKN